MRAGIYVRISQDRDARGAGVRRQLEDCEGWAQRNGAKVANVYEDNDTSAYSGKPRPAYRRLCDDIKSDYVDCVVTWHMDRLHRSPAELEEFIALVEAHHTRVVTITGGDYDLSTTDGRAMARVIGAFARKESEDKSRRIRRQKLQAAQQGSRSSGGTRAYGYDPTHKQLVPAEAAIIEEAARRALAGETLRGICQDLNERQVPTVTGAQWSSTVLRTILMSARISGQVELHGQVQSSGDWPAIVSPADTTRLKALLGDPTRRTSRSPRTYPLAGLLVCGICAARLVSRPRTDGRRRYVCAKGPGFHGCGRVATLAEPVEQLIADAVLSVLDGPALHAALQASTTHGAHEAQDELDDLEARLDDLAGQYGRREISPREWAAARAPLMQDIKALRTRMGQPDTASALYGFDSATQLRRQWPNLPPARQRAIVSTLIESITVNAAVKGRNRFDPNRFKPRWRA